MSPWLILERREHKTPNFRWCGRAASAARVSAAVLARRTPTRYTS